MVHRGWSAQAVLFRSSQGSTHLSPETEQEGSAVQAAMSLLRGYNFWQFDLQLEPSKMHMPLTEGASQVASVAYFAHARWQTLMALSHRQLLSDAQRVWS